MKTGVRLPLWLMIEVFAGTVLPAFLSVISAPYLLAILVISPFWTALVARPEGMIWFAFSLSYLSGGVAVGILWREAILLRQGIHKHSLVPVLLGVPFGVAATWAVMWDLGPEFGALVSLPPWAVAIHLLWWKLK